MSFSATLNASYFLAPAQSRRHVPRRGLPPRPRARVPGGQPVLFMGGLLLTISAGVIALWPAMGWLLPL